MTFMSLLLMMPNNSYYSAASQYLPYAQFGENLGSVSLLRVDGNPSTNSSYLKMYNAFTDSSGAPTYSVDASVWGNALTTYRYFSAQHQENPNNLNPFTYTAATMDLKNNAAGLLLTVPTAPSDCI
jgi:hypothetical protein